MKKYALPELPYGYAALAEPHYSARLLELHHGKHHAAERRRHCGALAPDLSAA